MSADYYYCIIKTTLEANGYVKIGAPCVLYSQRVIRDNVIIEPNLYAQYVGMDMIACIAVSADDKENIKNFEGFLGDTYEGVKDTEAYLTHVFDGRQFCGWCDE